MRCGLTNSDSLNVTMMHPQVSRKLGCCSTALKRMQLRCTFCCLSRTLTDLNISHSMWLSKSNRWVVCVAFMLGSECANASPGAQLLASRVPKLSEGKYDMRNGF
jgi:hypothetical protein